jgi:hypothetical protein
MLVRSLAELDLSELRGHVARDHRDVGEPAPDDRELSLQHARSHVLRFSSHVHVTPVVEIRIGGPVASIVPGGWLTGQRAMTHADWLRALRQEAAIRRTQGDDAR